MPAEKDRLTRKAEISKMLYQINAVHFGVFKLTNGRISPYYVDLRVVPSFPDAFREICDLYRDVIQNEVGTRNFERIAGMPMAGIPFAAQIAYILRKPLLFVRKDTRRHGRKKRIEGILVPGERVLLIDDLVTTGLTLQKTYEIIIAEGGIVKDAIVLLDREEGGKENLGRIGIQLHAMLKVSEAAETLFGMGAIDKEELKTIQKQVKK